MLQEFKQFIARGNVIDMAVGIVMGASFTAIVNSAVGDIIMPLIGWIMSGVDFSNYFIQLSGGTKYETLKQAKESGITVISYGVLINAIINFLAVSFFVFWVVKAAHKLRAGEEKKAEEIKASAPPPAPSEDILLLREIRDQLRNQNHT